MASGEAKPNQGETPSGWFVDRTALPFARLSGHPDGAWKGLINWLFAVETFNAV